MKRKHDGSKLRKSRSPHNKAKRVTIDIYVTPTLKTVITEELRSLREFCNEHGLKFGHHIGTALLQGLDKMRFEAIVKDRDERSRR